MTAVTDSARIDSGPGGRQPTADGLLGSRLGQLALAAGLLHGPLDVALTLSAWRLEANPVVVDLGPAPWVVAKAAALAGLAASVLLARRDARARRVVGGLLVALVAVGIGAVAGNLAVLAGVMG